MVCVTLAEKSLARCRAALQGLDFAEIRMDVTDMTIHDIPSLFTGKARLIATCRPGDLSDRERRGLLMAAIDAGASYVDVEMESQPDYREPIVERARLKGCKVIVSYHDYQGTPEREELEGIASQCFVAGADIVKIACMVRSVRDNVRLFGLLDTERPIVVIGMGVRGSITRIMAPLLGSPFTYGAYEKGKEVVAGQLDHRTISDHLDLLRGVTTDRDLEKEGVKA